MRTGPEKVLKLIAIAMGGLVVLMAAMELQDAVKKERGTFFDGAVPRGLDE